MQWPSLLIWRALGEDLGEKKRSVDPLLLLECAAVLLVTLAAAGPSVEGGRGGRKVVVHLETGPRTGALLDDGRTVLEATRAELERIRGALASEDEWIVHEMERVDAPPASGDIRILATNRPDVEGPGLMVVGRAPTLPNIGFAAVQVEGAKIGFTVRRDCGDGPVQVLVAGKAMRVEPGQWVTIEGVTAVRLTTPNCLAGDDALRLRAIELNIRLDSESPLLRAAMRVGLPATPGEPADLALVTKGGTLISDPVRGADCIAEPGLFDDLFLDECRWQGVRGVREPGLLRWGEWTLARWVDERTLWIGLPVDREWDDYGTLAVLLERAKRERVEAMLAPGEALVGDAIVSPAPHFVDTRGVDRPWDGTLPDIAPSGEGRFDLRALLAIAAALVLAVYLLRLGR